MANFFIPADTPFNKKFFNINNTKSLAASLKPSNRYGELRNKLRKEKKQQQQNQQYQQKQQKDRSHDELSKLSFYSDSNIHRSKNRERLPTLNIGARKKETLKQNEENLRLMKRILDTKPVISRRRLEKDWKKNENYISLASQYSHFNRNDTRKYSSSDVRNSRTFGFGNQGVGFRYKKISDIGYTPTSQTKVLKTDGSPTTLQDILSYIEENEPEGDYEIFLTDNVKNEKQSVKPSLYMYEPKIEKKTGILKTGQIFQRPASKVSFIDEPLIIQDERPSRRRFFKTPDEIIIDAPASTPAVFDEESEIEIIYLNPSRNEIINNESRAVSKLDHDRIKMLYDERNSNNSTIHVVYNDDQKNSKIKDTVKYQLTPVLPRTNSFIKKKFII